MASITVNTSDFVADGVTLSVYKRSAWGVEGITGTPSGAAVTTGTAAAGTVTFNGLNDNERYIAYDSVSGRFRRFSTPPVSSSAGTLASRPAANSVGSGFIYFATDDNGGTSYRSDGTGWTKIAPGVTETGGRELAYDNLDATFTVTATANTDYDTGLAITVDSGSSPIYVRAKASVLQHSVAGAQVQWKIKDELANVVAQSSVTAPAQTTGSPSTSPISEDRVTPTAGAHTYRAYVRSNTAGTITLTSVAGVWSWIAAFAV